MKRLIKINKGIVEVAGIHLDTNVDGLEMKDTTDRHYCLKSGNNPTTVGGQIHLNVLSVMYCECFTDHCKQKPAVCIVRRA